MGNVADTIVTRMVSFFVGENAGVKTFGDNSKQTSWICSIILRVQSLKLEFVFCFRLAGCNLKNIGFL